MIPDAVTLETQDRRNELSPSLRRQSVGQSRRSQDAEETDGRRRAKPETGAIKGRRERGCMLLEEVHILTLKCSHALALRCQTLSPSLAHKRSAATFEEREIERGRRHREKREEGNRVMQKPASCIINDAGGKEALLLSFSPTLRTFM